MSRTNQVMVFAFTLLALSGAPVFAAEAAPRLPGGLQSKQQGAAKKLGQVAQDYATFCAATGAYSEARQWFGAAISIGGNDRQIRAEFAKIAGKPDKPDKTFAKDSATRLGKLKAAGKDLFQFIKETRAQDCEGLAVDEIALWCTFAWDENLLKAEKYEWYEPLHTIAPSSDIVRFKKGELRLNGKWLSAADVAKLENEHASFANPWLFKDGWFEVRADVPLACALATLNHATLWRAHLWGQFSAEMELRRPEGLLPIYACATRGSLDAQSTRYLQSIGAQAPKSYATAFYRNVLTFKLNPLFISLEEISDEGQVCPGSDAGYFELLNHELSHQLLTEGEKYKEDKAPECRPTWVIEAFGAWAETWVLQNGRFTQHFYRSTPTGSAGTSMPSLLELARRWKDQLLTFKEFCRQSSDEFSGHEMRSYAQTSLAALCLLQGGDNALRQRFMRVADAAHCFRCDRRCIEEGFKGVDGPALDTKMLALLDSIQFEDR